MSLLDHSSFSDLFCFFQNNIFQYPNYHKSYQDKTPVCKQRFFFTASKLWEENTKSHKSFWIFLVCSILAETAIFQNLIFFMCNSHQLSLILIHSPLKCRMYTSHPDHVNYLLWSKWFYCQLSLFLFVFVNIFIPHGIQRCANISH